MNRFLYRDFLRNTRFVLPPPWAVMLALIIYATPEAFVLFTDGIQRFRLARSPVSSAQVGVLMYATVAAALLRLWLTHPIFRKDYREWLLATRWQPAKSLPLGPVYLVPGDVLLIAGISALIAVRHPDYSPWLVPLVYLFVYLLLSAFAFFRLGPRRFGYATLFGVGCVVMWLNIVPVAAAIAAGTYLIAVYGLQQSLRKLSDFEPGVAERILNSQNIGSGADNRTKSVDAAWWIAKLAAQRSPIHFPWFDGLCITFTVGWLTTCLLMLLVDRNWRILLEPDKTYAGLLLAFPLFAGLIIARVVAYVDACRPPISILGRIFTGRLIIPSYDRAFVAPICALLGLFAGMMSIVVIGMAAVPLTVMFVIGSLLLTEPAYRDWILTSNCRIGPNFLFKSSNK